MRRLLDVVFFSYYLFQVVGTVFMDTQALFPAWLYPQPLRAIFKHYLTTFRDPYMAELTNWPWFMSICLAEFAICIPFFFVATYAYYKGAHSCPWIRVPVIMYCCHLLTATFGVILNTILQPDFGKYSTAAYPRNMQERLLLCGVYGSFFFVSLLNLLDALLSDVYQPKLHLHNH